MRIKTHPAEAVAMGGFVLNSVIACVVFWHMGSYA